MPKQPDKPSEAVTTHLNDKQHCVLMTKRCASAKCQVDLQHEILRLKSNSSAASSVFDARYETARALVSDITELGALRECLAGSLAVSEKALHRAVRAKVDPVNCECAACLLTLQKHASAIMSEKNVAVTKYIADLREYRAACERKPMSEDNEK